MDLTHELDRLALTHRRLMNANAECHARQALPCIVIGQVVLGAKTGEALILGYDLDAAQLVEALRNTADLIEKGGEDLHVIFTKPVR